MEILDRNKHKDEFLQYIIDNEDMLRKALKKNITFDPDIFDDVTCNTIVRIAEYILGKGVRIKSFKDMFFLSAKREYIQVQNKKRKKQANDIPNFTELFDDGKKNLIHEEKDIKFLKALTSDDDGKWKEKEEKANRINDFYQWLEMKLNEVFPPGECDIFIFYYRLKSNKTGVSYKKLAKILDVPVKYITDVIVKIKKYIKQSEEIQNKKIEMIDKNDNT